MFQTVQELRSFSCCKGQEANVERPSTPGCSEKRWLDCLTLVLPSFFVPFDYRPRPQQGEHLPIFSELLPRLNAFGWIAALIWAVVRSLMFDAEPKSSWDRHPTLSCRGFTAIQHPGYSCTCPEHLTHCKDQVGGDPMTLAIAAWAIGWVILIVVVTLFGDGSRPVR